MHWRYYSLVLNHVILSPCAVSKSLVNQQQQNNIPYNHYIIHHTASFNASTSSVGPTHMQGYIYECAQPMGDDVILQRRLSVAGGIHKTTSAYGTRPSSLLSLQMA